MPIRPTVLLVVSLACIACGDAVVDKTTREVPAYDIEQFLDTTDFRGGSFSPDGNRVLVSSDRSGIYNACFIPADGGEPVPLTESTTESILAVSYFPQDERFLFQSDRGGDENTHVFVREVDGSVRDLTPGDGLRAEWHGWSGDDTSFYLGTNERDPRLFDIWEYSAADYSREMIYRNEGGYELAAISRDGRFLALDKRRTTSESDVWLHDRETGESRRITPLDAEARYRARDFSPDGAHLYLTTNDGREFAYLARYDLTTGKLEEVERPDWDVVGATFSEAGSYLAVSVNADARTDVRVYRMDGGGRVELPEFPQGVITSVKFSRDDRRMLLHVSNARHPRDLWVFDLEAGTTTRITRSLSPQIDPEHLVEGRVVRFASYDDRQIPGILYRPHRASSRDPAPALVWVHGGPGGQSLIGYHPLIQYLVNHGYAVFAINNRGSTGYGRSFQGLDDRAHGDVDLKDCLASKRMLVNTGWVDPGKIGIIGRSYGGFMVLAALAFEPNEFEVGVDIFGVANWLRTLQSIPPYWESFREALYDEMGDPTTDAERLRRISPLFHAERIRKPLLVLQGANDPRVLRIESDEMVEAARANGATVDYVVFDDEGHGFRKKENRRRGYRMILDFLDKHLS